MAPVRGAGRTLVGRSRLAEPDGCRSTVRARTTLASRRWRLALVPRARNRWRDDRGAIVRWYGTHTDIDDQRRTLERTSRIATTLQSAFLPQTLPEHPHIRFDALYLTAGQEVLIGGDWYDAFAIPGGRIVVSIGDVTGHGLNAAVSAGRIRQSIVATAIDIHDPAEILTKVNRLLQFHDSTVATALVAIIEPDALTLRYASAGHPSPIHAGRTHSAHALPHGSLPLGVSHTPDYRTHTVSLARNDVMVFYTDGITEFHRDLEATERALQAARDRCGRNVAVTATGRTNSTRGSRRRCTKRRCGARRASRCTARCRW